jgi:hypothetical protein
MRQRKSLGTVHQGTGIAATASGLASKEGIVPAVRSLNVTKGKDWATGDTVVTGGFRTYAMGFRVTEDMINDDHDIVAKMATQLGDSLRDNYDRQMHGLLKDGYPNNNRLGLSYPDPEWDDEWYDEDWS